MAKRKPRHDVQWYLPGKKKPIAGSALCVSLFIVGMAQKYNTIQEIHDAINYDMDAKDILRLYIDKGYGQTVARDIFK